ncbi:MAG: glycosyltransferase family 1 protein [Oscillospiraceae bacterium]|nr:glycosyltransferase family 1 protein [Oscillospiraceae bacterium]
MNNPIRILHVFGRTDRGGAETFVMNIYRNIDRTKVQFDFMVHTEDKCAYDDEILALGGQIFRVPRYNGKNHFGYKKAWKNFFANHPEHKIIHGHITSTAAIYLKIAKKFNKTTISHIHSTASLGSGVGAKAKSMLERRAKNHADYLFACSKPAAEWCYGADYHTNSNFHIIKNAIDVQKFAFNETSRAKTRSEFGLDDKFVVGHVGNFSTPKNHTFLIDIFAEISRKNSDAVLLLVGGGQLRGEIEEKVRSLGLMDSVIFAGIRTDIPELLCAMDVFVFPSLWEGFPVTMVEAQTSGLTCVISDTITNEVEISELVEFVSLSSPPPFWTDIVLSGKHKNLSRRYFSEKVAQAGFDVQATTECLEKIYSGV